MSQFVDCNGVPLKIGDLCFVVKHIRFPELLGKVIEVTDLFTSARGNEVAGHAKIGRCDGTMTIFLKKIQDLDDDDCTKNNILFSTTSDNWERITDYPAKPKLEPELEPSKV